MFLSDEQSGAASYGLGPLPEWEWVDLPAGPMPLPKWAKGLHVDWMLGWSNVPDFRIKCAGNLRRWPDMRYAKEGPRFMATHTDGRADIYYHDGAIRLVTLKRRIRTSRTEWHDEEYEALATTQQSGFGGSHYPLIIGGKSDLRGKTVVLRGPWHGPSPAGYLDCAYVDITAEWLTRSKRDARPWWRMTGMGGLYITEDLFLRLVARFQPHLRVARIHRGKRSRLELAHPHWSAPKGFLPREELDAFKVAA